jgi:hypothetical protein
VELAILILALAVVLAAFSFRSKSRELKALNSNSTYANALMPHMYSLQSILDESRTVDGYNPYRRGEPDSDQKDFILRRLQSATDALGNALGLDPRIKGVCGLTCWEQSQMYPLYHEGNALFQRGSDEANRLIKLGVGRIR